MEKSKILNNPIFARLITLLTVVFSALSIYIVTRLNRFGSLSKKMFIIINIFVFISVACIILMSWLSIRQKRFKVRLFLIVFLIISSIGLGYLTGVLEVVNANLKEITTETSTIEKHAVFVTQEDSLIESIEDFKSKNVGIVNNEQFDEGHTMPKEELEDKQVLVNYVHYNNYTQMLHGLTNKDIDIASFPKNYMQLLNSEETDKELKETRVVYEYSSRKDNVDLHSGTDLDVTTTPFTLLIMGNDGGRTDSLMIASVNPNTMQVTLTSIARDSYVPIACYTNNGRDKINHARTVSRDCTIKTVEDLLDIKVDFFAEINFEGLIDVVDALGGLEVDSPAEFTGNKWPMELKESVRIPKGVSILDGQQTLAFVRERYSFEDGDFQRQRNQQQVMSKLVKKAVETRDINKLLNVLRAAGDNVETNVSVDQMVDVLNLAITRMDSSYIKNPSIFTFYGSRITGRGEMIYTPAYGMELYYYVLYNGSIKEAQQFISWNLRTDNELDLPKGFNYDHNEDRKPPVFSTEFFDEEIDLSISHSPDPTPEIPANDNEKPEENSEPLIYIANYIGQPLSNLQSYAQANGLNLSVSTEVEYTQNASQIGNTVIKSHSYIGKSIEAGTTIEVVLVEYKEEVIIDDSNDEVENESEVEDQQPSDNQ